jgi:protein O-GlcNAc transferase
LNSVPQLLSAAAAAEKHGDTHLALRHYAGVLAIDAAHPVALFRLAQNFLRGGVRDKALLMLRSAIAAARERGLAAQSLPIHQELVIALRAEDTALRLVAVREALADCGEVPGLIWEECDCLRILNEKYARLKRLNRLAALQPKDHVILAELGLAFANNAPLAHQAIAPLREALALGATGHEIVLALASIEIYLKQFETAELRLHRVLSEDPNNIGALGKLWFIERAQCRWHEAATHEQQMLQRIDTGAYSEWLTPFMLLDSTIAASALRDYALRFAQMNDRPARKQIAKRSPSSAQRRLRIGYLSGDFHTHAVACHIVGLIEAHDKARVELFAYSCGARVDTDPYRIRLQQAFDHWRNLNELNDDDAAKLIADDDIDVLFDLSGPTHGNRSGVLTRRPSHQVIHYLGYPGTIASGDVDWLLADETVLPIEHEPFYCERVLRMPMCYQVNDPHRERPDAPPRAAHGLPEDAIVICNFNRPAKWTEAFLRIWCRALAAQKKAVLWLYETDIAKARPAVLAIAEEYGVADRIVWAPVLGMTQHLARLRCADLALDQLPYSSHATGANALWMGVPLLTCVGEMFQGRVGASLVKAVGLHDFVVNSLGEYEHALHGFLASSERLAAAKRHLLESEALPLFDSVRFARELEKMLFEICERKQP